MIMQTSTTTGLFSGPRTQYSSQASALLLGEAGQMRCDFAWDAMMTMATGVCADSRNNTYDLLIKN
jgi:hypothetical protein